MWAAALAPQALRLVDRDAIRVETRAVLARTVAMPGLPVVCLVALAGATAAIVSVMAVLTGGRASAPGVQAALMAWITLAYVFSGLVAWWRRPGNRLGPLMIAAGFGTFLSSLSVAGPAAPYTVGTAFDLLAAVLFLQVFLTFPSGRLQGTAERALVGAGYVAAFGAQLVGMALDGFGPDNALAVVSAPHVANTLLRAQLLVLSALALAAIGVLALRRRDSPRPLRPALAALVHSFAIALLMLAFLYTSAALGLASGQPLLETIRRATMFAVGLAPVAFLLGLLDARLARSAVGDLFVELRGSRTPADLGAALGRALRDPSLTLAYWLPEFGTWTDVDGRPVRLPDGTGPSAATLVERDGHPVAALVHDASLREEPELLDAVAAAAAIALENAQLHVELLARLGELKASRARVVEAGDAERRRLERNLHDGAQQRLVGVAMHLRLLRNRIADDPAAAVELATTAYDEVAHSLDELRELARGLHPAVLEHGLHRALDALATRSPVATTVSYDIGGRLPRPLELAAYFVACEALANVAKYAGAASATVRVRGDGPRVIVEIADDGAGGADAARGTGLRGLADRVEALDGRLRVVSPPGAGTVVTAELPVATLHSGAGCGILSADSG
jgi:signal transduction histidine kinase